MNEFVNVYGYRLKSTDIVAMKDTTNLRHQASKRFIEHLMI